MHLQAKTKHVPRVDDALCDFEDNFCGDRGSQQAGVIVMVTAPSPERLEGAVDSETVSGSHEGQKRSLRAL
jgi:hypothetical protein